MLIVKELLSISLADFLFFEFFLKLLIKKLKPKYAIKKVKKLAKYSIPHTPCSFLKPITVF